MPPRVGTVAATGVAIAVIVGALLPAAADARVDFLPEPIGCRISALTTDGDGFCHNLYRGVSAGDVDTAFNAGRANPVVLFQLGGSVRFLYETPQTFNTVCFQQPPSVAQHGRMFQPLIANLEVWAVPANAVPGDVNGPLVAPDFTLTVSPDSELRCYALPREATAQRVVVRMSMSAQGTGPTAASTLVLGRDSAWEPAAAGAAQPSLAVPRLEDDESIPVPAADVVAIHPAVRCSPQSEFFTNSGCRSAIDTTPSPSDVNTAYSAGLSATWAPSPSTQAQLSLTLSTAQVVNGLCAQQRGDSPKSTFQDRAGRVDVWNGRVPDVNAASTRAPDATIVFPRSNGNGLLCYRLLNRLGGEVSFTAVDITLRVWKAFDAFFAHGLATALPAQITSPGPEPALALPTAFTFHTPISCSMDFSDSGAPSCATLYNTPVSTSDVGTSYPAGAKSTGASVRVYNGVVRFLFDRKKTMNTVCMKQPGAMRAWSWTVQPIMASLDIWAGNVPGAASWTEPAQAPHTVAVSASTQLLCYALPAELTGRNVSVRLSHSATSQGTAGASSLFFAYDPDWTAATTTAAAPAVNAGVHVFRGLQRETLPVAASMVRTIHRAVGCDPDSTWPDGTGRCRNAYDRVPSLSDVNTAFSSGMPSWIPDPKMATPLTLTLSASSYVNGVCYQQRGASAPAHNDLASLLEVWAGRVSESAMETTAPLATVVIPRSAGRELFCYPLVNAATGADVNFTSSVVSFRLWAIQGLYGAQGAATLLPAAMDRPVRYTSTLAPLPNLTMTFMNLTTVPNTTTAPMTAPIPIAPIVPDPTPEPTPVPTVVEDDVPDVPIVVVVAIVVVAVAAVAAVVAAIVWFLFCRRPPTLPDSKPDAPPEKEAPTETTVVEVEGEPVNDGLDKPKEHPEESPTTPPNPQIAETGAEEKTAEAVEHGECDDVEAVPDDANPNPFVPPEA